MKRILCSLFLFLFLEMTSWSAFTLEQVKINYQSGDGQRAGVMTSSGLFEGTPEQVWNVVMDVNNHSKIIPRTLVAIYLSPEGLETIKRSDSQNPNRLGKLVQKYKIEAPRKAGGVWEAFVFKLIDSPFPIVNRWVVVHLVSNETQFRQHRYEQNWTFVAGNVEDSYGYFRIEPTDNPGSTRLNYSQAVAAGGHIPEWAMRLGAGPVTRGTFKGIQRFVVATQAPHE